MMASKNYEELDPDNQDRSQDYYQGVRDTATYVLCILTDSRGSDQMSVEVRAAVEEMDKLICMTEERRMAWFTQFMSVKLDPVREFKATERKVSAAELQVAPAEV
jgi:hypothetical protein